MATVVTGCAGFIGAHLSRALLDAGHDVRGVDALTSNYDVALKRSALAALADEAGFEFEQLDLAAGDVARTVRGADTVFHLAAEPGVTGSWGDAFPRYAERNVVATQRLLEAVADAAPGATVVYASSSSVYGDAHDTAPRPRSPYGVTKLAAEHLCRAYADTRGLGVAILRYFSVFGPGQRPDMGLHRFCRAALTGGTVTLRGEGQRRDFTYVDDIVRATLLAAAIPSARGRCLDIGSGSPRGVREALDLIADLAETEVDVRAAPTAPGEVQGIAADPSAARDVLGWEPRTGLREGLAQQLSWTRDLLGRGVLTPDGPAVSSS